MKKTTSIILLLTALMLSTACSKSPTPSTPSTGTTAPAETVPQFDNDIERKHYEYWITYENPKLNEEVTAYGYDDDGVLTLPLSELRHCEETYPRKIIITRAPIEPVSERYNKKSAAYYRRGMGLEITGYVTDLVSHCKRKVHMNSETTYLPKQWTVDYDGYTETKIMITGVLAVGTHDNGEEYDYSFLIGKKVTVIQQGYWYYDDNGELRKDGFNMKYTYVLKPNTEAVIAIENIKVKEKFSTCTTGAEAYAILTNQENPCYVYDFYPVTNKQGEKMTNSAMLEEYFKSLDEEYGGLYDPWGKKNAVKENLAL